MIRGTLGVIAALLLAGGAQAQEAPKTPPPTAAGEQAAPAEQPTELTSTLAGATFLYPGFALTDDGTYREALDAIAGLEKSKCGTLEAFGWTYQNLAIGETIFTATIHDIEKAGFELRRVDIEQFEGKRVFPFYARGPRGVLLLLWLADEDAAQVSLCDVVPVK